jgi:hypothetical protein
MLVVSEQAEREPLRRPLRFELFPIHNPLNAILNRIFQREPVGVTVDSFMMPFFKDDFEVRISYLQMIRIFGDVCQEVSMRKGLSVNVANERKRINVQYLGR